ncbi:hypothetical protein EFM11_02375 [Lactobacillus helveticus]|nr:hypothetical protein [Lactobacillus helveticus]MCT0164404.1 hypothetical protein [Lactobacillus helveticus]
MTAGQYYKFRKHHALLEEAKKLDKLNADETANIKRFIAFKQRAGMMPKEYIERYKDYWKD